MRSGRFNFYVIVSVVFAIIIHLTGFSKADGQGINKYTEKPISIKGLSLGMNVNDARNIAIKLFDKNYVVTPVADSKYLLKEYSENQYINSIHLFRTGKGFFIQGIYSHNNGFVIAEGNDDKVTRICLNGSIINFLYSASEVSADDFVEQFESHFGLPALFWIPHGWTYSSALYGYTLMITTNKLIDISCKYDHSTKKTKKIEF